MSVATKPLEGVTVLDLSNVLAGPFACYQLACLGARVIKVESPTGDLARRLGADPAYAREAMGITGFTLPTLYRWVQSDRGRAASLHPFMKGHYLGSGQAAAVLKEAGLDGESQFKAIEKYVRG